MIIKRDPERDSKRKKRKGKQQLEQGLHKYTELPPEINTTKEAADHFARLDEVYCNEA